MLVTLLTQMVQGQGSVLRHPDALLFLAVKDAQRVFVKAIFANRAKLVKMLMQILFQRLVIARTAHGAADGVDVGAQVPQPQPVQDMQDGDDHLRVRGGLLCAKALHAKLVMLAESS